MDEYGKIARKIVDFAGEHGVGVVMEGLKGVGKRISYGGRLNRGLHSLSFRRLQSS